MERFLKGFFFGAGCVVENDAGSAVGSDSGAVAGGREEAAEDEEETDAKDETEAASKAVSSTRIPESARSIDLSTDGLAEIG